MSDIEKLPKTAKQEIFILLSIGGHFAGALHFADYDSSDYDENKILLGTQNVKFNIPQNVDIKGKAIEGLEDQKSKLLARHHMELKGVQDKIDNLLAIEYKPEETQ